jgi:esterase/lipase superfamily enzyme
MSASMNREYLKRYSQELQRDMEVLSFGHAGMPVVVFPTSMGRFYDYEDRGMIATLAPKIDSGQLHVFCVDSVDGESWDNGYCGIYSTSAICCTNCFPSFDRRMPRRN